MIKFTSHACAMTLMSVLAFTSAENIRAAVVLIDFGNTPTTGSVTPIGSSTPEYWNNVSSSGVTNLALVDTGSNSTGFLLTAGGFNEQNFGPTLTTGAIGLLAVNSAAVDYVYVGSGNTYSFTLSGLDTSLTYDFSFFGSTTGRPSSRTTQYTAAGTTTVNSLPLLNYDQPANTPNTTNVATIAGITPSGSGMSGIITLSFTDVSSSFSYLNSLQISAVPEPSTVLFLGAAGAVLMTLRRKRVQA